MRSFNCNRCGRHVVLPTESCVIHDFYWVYLLCDSCFDKWLKSPAKVRVRRWLK